MSKWQNVNGIPGWWTEKDDSMKTYVVYFSCPNCKHPCSGDPNEKANECLYADSKAEARKIFNSLKPCRNMKITEIKKTNF